MGAPPGKTALFKRVLAKLSSMRPEQEKDGLICRSLHRYQIVCTKEIGKGAFGRVFAAHMGVEKSRVAVKIPIHWNIEEPGRREMETTRYLNQRDIPHTSRCKACCPISLPGGKTVYALALSYLRAERLSARLFSSTKTLLSWAHQMLETLGYFAECRMAHADLKVNNLLWENGRLSIIDFGNAVFFPRGAARVLPRFPIASARAPEALLEQPATPSVDMWSFGVLFFALFTGESPFSGDTDEKILQQILQKLGEETLPPSWKELPLVQKLLEGVVFLRDSWENKMRRAGKKRGDPVETVEACIDFLRRIFVYEHRLTPRGGMGHRLFEEMTTLSLQLLSFPLEKQLLFLEFRKEESSPPFFSVPLDHLLQCVHVPQRGPFSLFLRERGTNYSLKLGVWDKRDPVGGIWIQWGERAVIFSKGPYSFPLSKYHRNLPAMPNFSLFPVVHPKASLSLLGKEIAYAPCQKRPARAEIPKRAEIASIFLLFEKYSLFYRPKEIGLGKYNLAICRSEEDVECCSFVLYSKSPPLIKQFAFHREAGGRVRFGKTVAAKFEHLLEYFHIPLPGAFSRKEPRMEALLKEQEEALDRAACEENTALLQRSFVRVATRREFEDLSTGARSYFWIWPREILRRTYPRELYLLDEMSALKTFPFRAFPNGAVQAGFQEIAQEPYANIEALAFAIKDLLKKGEL